MSTRSSIQVLLVEDSPSAQLLLAHILGGDPKLRVMGTVASGEEAIEFLRHKQPDVVLMDIHLKGMNGFETTRRIMETHPLPIVICSGSIDLAEVTTSFQAMQAGAVAVVPKPAGPHHPDYQGLAAKLTETVRLMSEVKVVRRWRRNGAGEERQARIAALAAGRENACKVVVIGASTGGPPVLQTILAGLPKDFPIPVMIVQHIAAGFLPGLVEWLSQAAGFEVVIPRQGEPLKPGRACIAPDGVHMGLDKNHRVLLSAGKPENGLRPAVAHLFRSAGTACGANAVGVLLTGMGKDGAEELLRLKELGALTIAQDEPSSTVHGMAGEAIRLGAAQYILPPERIASVLACLARPGPV